MSNTRVRARRTKPVPAAPQAFQGPFTVKGCALLDRDGRQVAYCGLPHNRDASGPVVAAFLRDCANGVEIIDVDGAKAYRGDDVPDAD